MHKGTLFFVSGYLYLTLKQTRPKRKQGAQFAFKISRIHVGRNSPELSHFATFFLEQQAKVSIVKSCMFGLFSFGVHRRDDFNQNVTLFDVWERNLKEVLYQSVALDHINAIIMVKDFNDLQKVQ